LKPNNNAPCNIQIVYKHMVKLKHFMLSWIMLRRTLQNQDIVLNVRMEH
jgi:hypothetical protein